MMAGFTLTGASSTDRNADIRIPPQPRLVRAAHQFEAMMMKELLAPMSRGSALFQDSDGEETGVLGQFATESLAGALSAGGGLGIADQIVRDLSRSGKPPGSEPVTGKSEKCTRISTGK